MALPDYSLITRVVCSLNKSSTNKTQSKYASFIDFRPPKPSLDPLAGSGGWGRVRGRGSPPRRFLTGPAYSPAPWRP